MSFFTGTKFAIVIFITRNGSDAKSPEHRPEGGKTEFFFLLLKVLKNTVRDCIEIPCTGLKR
jgi:hypothetical protein